MSRNGMGEHAAENEALPAALAEVLAAHQIGYERRVYPAYACLCGWDGANSDNGGPNDGQHDTQESALAHVANQLARVISPRSSDAGDPSCR